MYCIYVFFVCKLLYAALFYFFLFFCIAKLCLFDIVKNIWMQIVSYKTYPVSF